MVFMIFEFLALNSTIYMIFIILKCNSMIFMILVILILFLGFSDGLINRLLFTIAILFTKTNKIKLRLVKQTNKMKKKPFFSNFPLNF